MQCQPTTDEFDTLTFGSRSFGHKWKIKRGNRLGDHTVDDDTHGLWQCMYNTRAGMPAVTVHVWTFSDVRFTYGLQCIFVYSAYMAL